MRNAPGWRGGSLLCVLCLLTSASAQDDFTPPQAYPQNRYEAGWFKNPFTLKTAPIALEKASFAQNLAIGSYFGSKENPTVVIVNTQTRERISLKQDAAGSNGMVLKSVSIMPNRKDITAEVMFAGETAVLHFDDSFIKQMAAQTTVQAPKEKAQAPAADGNKPNTLAVNNAAAGTTTDTRGNLVSPHPVGGPQPFPTPPGSPLPAAVYDSGTVSPGPGAASYVPTSQHRKRLTAPVSKSPPGPQSTR